MVSMSSGVFKLIKITNSVSCVKSSTMSRRQFTLDEKIRIIERLENGEKNIVIAKEYGTSSSTISTIWKSRHTLENMFQTTPLRAKRLRTAHQKDIEEAVLVWIKQQRLLNVPISGPILQAKTQQLAEKMKIENFKCSASWIQRFRQRHSNGFGKISGVSGNPSKRSFRSQENVTKMTKLSEIVGTLKKMAPLSLAESWDNVGLLVEPDDAANSPVDCVFLTNDLTEDVLQEAEAVNANLIISYHPPVFVPFKRLTSDGWKSRIVSRCLARQIAIYSPHTSWDSVNDGLTDWLVSCFDGTVTPVQPQEVKPEFSHVATLTWRKSDGEPLTEDVFKEILKNRSNFEVDKDFKILSYNQSQLQILCDSNIIVRLNEIAKSYDMYLHANKNESLPSSARGTGRRCQFKNGMTVNSAIKAVKEHLKVDNLMVALARGATMESTIDSAAAVAGSGASVLRGVKADLYLTGEMSHHDVLDAVHNGVTVVLANHSNTEREYLNVFAGKLRREMPLLNVRVSEVDRDPLLFV